MAKISIITISFNSSNTIKSTLESVKNQSFKDFEHIIIDGNSEDNTLEICNQFSHISKIVSEPDKGVYDAFNKGLELSTGEIIGFLNSDDIFYNSNILETISLNFDKSTDCVFGNLDYFNRKGKVTRKWRSKPYRKGAFLEAWMPAHPTFYCRKSIYDQLGRYDDSYKIAGDYELMLRFLEKNDINSKFINKTLIKMRVGGISNSGFGSKIKIIKEEIRAFKQNKIKYSLPKYFIHKALKIKEFF